MNKAELQQRLMTTFLEEMEDHLRAMNQDLLALEKGAPAEEVVERVQNLFRAAHSLKGAARSVNVKPIENACHRLEELLTEARDGRLELGPWFGLFFAAVDALAEAGVRLRAQQDLVDAPVTAILTRLDAAVGSAIKGKSGKSPGTGPGTQGGAGPKSTQSAPAQAAAMRVAVTRGPSAPPAVATSVAGQTDKGPQDRTAATGSLRVSAEKLDALLARSGELLVARRNVAERANDIAVLRDLVDEWKDVQPSESLPRLKKDLDRLARALRRDSRLLESVAGPLDDEVRRMRMLPFAEACAGLDRMVRDLAQAQQKNVELAIAGESVELDRSILEGLKDPLRHLVRNALDHGIEAPARRQELGKPRQARIHVAAELRGSQVEVSVRDDGRGLDLDALRCEAASRGVATPADEEALMRLIFMPGFSTAPLITDISGRGVGLDVVKKRVEALHGTVGLSHVPGGGTRFCLTVPLTLTTLRAVLVRASGQTYAFAGTNVHKLVRVEAASVRWAAGRSFLSLGGAPMPFAILSQVLQPGRAASVPTGKFPVLIIVAGEKHCAFAVDELVAEQELVVKNLGRRIVRAPFAAGATLLSSGRVALVLNAAHVVEAALHFGAAPNPEPTVASASKRKRVLVVEDSVTTRTLEKTILEAAGYEVATTVDGQAGWDYLQEHAVDLVVSDVEMPRMDGFELTRAIRASARLRELPVILVTARERDTDKTRGIEVGADAYLVKSAFDQQNLLAAIGQLL